MSEARTAFDDVDVEMPHSSEEASQHDSGSTCESDKDEFKGASILQMSFNLGKNLVGEGILSLPAGLAAGGGLFVGIIILLLIYCLMVYTYWVVGRVCHFVSEKTHKGAGDKITSGRSFGYSMALVNLLKNFQTLITYVIVIGEHGQHSVQLFGIEGWYSSRQVCYLVIAIAIVFPLSLMREMSNLAPFSLVGLAVEILTVIFVVVRWADGSYQPGGRFYETIDEKYRPSWEMGTGSKWWSVTPGTLVLFANLILVFVGHYNAPKFYHQLRNRDSARFLKTTQIGMSFALVLYIVCMGAGYLTFGKNCAGNILENYSKEDPFAGVVRASLLVAIVVTFPLVFTGMRDATISMSGISSRRRNWIAITVVLMIPPSVVGCVLDDIGVLNSLGGSFMGCLIGLVFPGMMLLFAYKSSYRGDITDFEGKKVAPVIIAFGAVMTVICTSLVVCIKVLHVDLTGT